MEDGHCSIHENRHRLQVPRQCAQDARLPRFDAFADPQASTDNALADLKGTVGSISAFGNGWLLNAKPARSLISYLVPACASSMRLLAQIDERKLIAAAGLNVTHVDTNNEYKAGDSLARGRLVAFAAHL